jgi:hypothetical protein
MGEPKPSMTNWQLLGWIIFILLTIATSIPWWGV